MSKRRRVIAGAMAVLVVGAIGTGVAVATGGDEEALTGGAYDRATAAALDYVGGGTVTDRNFKVVGTENDDDGPNDNDQGREDD